MFSCFKKPNPKPAKAWKWCPIMNGIGINSIIIKKRKNRYDLQHRILSGSEDLQTYMDVALYKLKHDGINSFLTCLLQHQKYADEVLEVLQNKRESWQGRVFLQFDDNKSLPKRNLEYIEDSQSYDTRIASLVRCKKKNSEQFDGENKNIIFDIFVREIEKGIFIITLNDITLQYETERILSEMVENQLDIMCESMPRHIVEFLMTQNIAQIPSSIHYLTKSHQNVTIMFLDIVGFTSIAKKIGQQNIITLLNHFFTKLDNFTDKHHVSKVETAGDSYIVSSGVISNIPTKNKDLRDAVEQTMYPWQSAKNVLEFSKDALCAAQHTCIPSLKHECLSIRIGIHTGEVVSGLIGYKLPKFSLFGDTMNIASRMESTSSPNIIHVSIDTSHLLPHEEWKYTGGTDVKGRGWMDTYILIQDIDEKRVCEIQSTRQTPSERPFVRWINTTQLSRSLGKKGTSRYSLDSRHSIN